MNASRISCLGGSFCFLLLVAGPQFLAAGRPAPTTQRAIESIAQLAAGKAAGTYHLVYRARAELTLPGHCALMIRISEHWHEIATLRSADAGEFTAKADLPPGTYSVVVDPANPDAGYWSSGSQSIHIDKAGRLYQPFQWWGQTAGVFVLRRNVDEMSPANLAIAEGRQPVLKWPAIPGATHYRGSYYTADHRGREFIVDETRYLIVGGLNAGEWCRWEIDALDDAGKVLAHGVRTFLGLGTDQAVIAQMRSAAGGTCGVPPQPQPGRPYLGVSPHATQVPKDPAVPAELPASDGRSMTGPAIQDESSGFIPGIQVREVLSGSPAVDADLHPDDVIIALDGERVQTMLESNRGDESAFARQISEMQPGRQITLTVRRFPRELTIRATIGRYPGAAATQPAVAPPATAPAADSNNRAPAAPVSYAVWSDVAPGRPGRRPFHAAPGTDIPLLSISDAHSANRMAELPHGEIAFGSWEGLGIWDGAEIRTYTEESPRGKRGKPMAEHRGLPSSMIQDLLCDSHGRLWVATGAGVCVIDMTAPATARWRVLADPEPDASSPGGRDHTLSVEKVFETSDGTIVLGGRFSGITLVDPRTEIPKLIHSDGQMNHWITGIAEDSRHRLWFSVTGVGVLRYDGAAIEQIHGPWIVGEDLRGICIDGAGTVWSADGKAGLGALHADGTTERFDPEQLAGGHINGLSTDRIGRVWVTSAGGLAVRAPDDSHGKNKPWQYAGPGGDRLWCALIARDGSLWTSGSDISRSAKLQLGAIKPRAAAIEKFKRETEKTYPNVKSDRRTAVGAGGIMVAVAGARLLRFDGKKWDDLTESFESPDVSLIRADRKGNIWIATFGNGLIGLDPTGGVRRYNNDPNLMKSYIYDIDEAPDGILYAGTGDGLYRLRDRTWASIETDQPVYQVGKVLVDRRGRVWLAESTYDNLFVYDGNRVRDAKDQTVLIDEKIEEKSLRLDNAGNVLVDIPARPADGVPKRTFRWNASLEGKIGQPVEVRP